MRTYAVRQGMIPAAKVELFESMRSQIADLPDLEPDDRVSCHVLTRVLASLNDGPVVIDGWFGGKGNEHSWLDIGDGLIADVYPIGGATPFLVDASGWWNPWNKLYVPHPAVMEGKDGIDETVRLLLEHATGRPR